MLYRVSAKIFARDFIVFTEEMLEKLDLEIRLRVRLEDRRLDYEVAEIAVFWLTMLV